MIRWLKSFFSKNHYTYGRVKHIDGSYSSKGTRRVNNRTGKLELILWHKNEHGHTEDFWHECGDGWVDCFEPYQNKGHNND